MIECDTTQAERVNRERIYTIYRDKCIYLYTYIILYYMYNVYVIYVYMYIQRERHRQERKLSDKGAVAEHYPVCCCIVVQ